MVNFMNIERSLEKESVCNKSLSNQILVGNKVFREQKVYSDKRFSEQALVIDAIKGSLEHKAYVKSLIDWLDRENTRRIDSFGVCDQSDSRGGQNPIRQDSDYASERVFADVRAFVEPKMLTVHDEMLAYLYSTVSLCPSIAGAELLYMKLIQNQRLTGVMDDVDLAREQAKVLLKRALDKGDITLADYNCQICDAMLFYDVQSQDRITRTSWRVKRHELEREGMSRGDLLREKIFHRISQSKKTAWMDGHGMFTHPGVFAAQVMDFYAKNAAKRRREAIDSGVFSGVSSNKFTPSCGASILLPGLSLDFSSSRVQPRHIMLDYDEVAESVVLPRNASLKPFVGIRSNEGALCYLPISIDQVDHSDLDGLLEKTSRSMPLVIHIDSSDQDASLAHVQEKVIPQVLCREQPLESLEFVINKHFISWHNLDKAREFVDNRVIDVLKKIYENQEALKDSASVCLQP